MLLSGRTAEELRSVEGRYQAQLVQDKARQIELYGQRYRDVVTGARNRADFGHFGLGCADSGVHLPRQLGTRLV